MSRSIQAVHSNDTGAPWIFSAIAKAVYLQLCVRPIAFVDSYHWAKYSPGDHFPELRAACARLSYSLLHPSQGVSNMNEDAHIRSIGRSLAVLRAINQAGAMSMAQISQAVGIPYPTTCRIVYTLQEEGVIERETSRKYYRPTALVQSLSHGYQDHSDLVHISRPELETLTHQHFWPISLTTRVGQFMVVRDCTHSLSPMALTNYQPGATFPILECASGHVMLAFAEPEQRANLLEALVTCDKAPDPHIVEILRSDPYVEAIRTDGYAMRDYNRFTNTPGRTSSIAVPVFHHGEVYAALTLVYFAVSMDREKAVNRYVADLRRAAAAITLRLAERRSGEPVMRRSKTYVESPELGIA